MKAKMSKSILLIVPLLAGQANALHKIAMQNNDHARITINNRGLCRLFVKGEKITAVHGLVGDYKLLKGTYAGDVYLAPTSNNTFNLFVSTNKKHHYALWIKGDAKADESVEIVPSYLHRSSNTKAKHHVMTGYYNQIIRALAKHRQPRGFTPNTSTTISCKSNHVCRASSIVTYNRRHLYASTVKVHNASAHDIQLSPSLFALHGKYQALGYDTLMLAPGKTTTVYMVVTHG